MQYLSAWRARFGQSSPMCMPGTVVEIGRSSPRISAGGFGFKSKVSSCGGPPVRKSRTQRLALPKPGGGEAPGVVSTFDDADQFVEVDLNRDGVPVLRALNQEHHQKSNDGRAGVDHQLPGIAEAKVRAG